MKQDFNEAIAWGTVITLTVFPTAFFFSALYAESLFLLFSVLVYTCSARGRYLLAGVFVAAASLTRPTGILLAIIPFVELLRYRGPSVWPRFLGTGASSAMGLLIYGWYLWRNQGSPLAFSLAEHEQWNRSLDWPWKALWDGFALAMRGYLGHGRASAAGDLLSALLFILCALLGFLYLRKSLAAYLLVGVIALLASHGPHVFGLFSWSRFVLGFFPGFIVLGILLNQYPRAKWAVWSISAVALMLLTGVFSSGRWVA